MPLFCSLIGGIHGSRKVWQVRLWIASGPVTFEKSIAYALPLVFVIDYLITSESICDYLIWNTVLR